MEIINIMQWKKDKENKENKEHQKKQYISASYVASPNDIATSERLGRIRASLTKINQLMAELKKQQTILNMKQG